MEEELEGLQTSVLSAIAQCFSTKGTTLFSKKYLANLSPALNELGHKMSVFQISFSHQKTSNLFNLIGVIIRKQTEVEGGEKATLQMHKMQF